MKIIGKENYLIIINLIILLIISLISLISADEINMFVNNIVNKQLGFLIIGFLIFLLIMKYGNKLIIKHNVIIFIILNLLLLGLFFVEPINNARCWYKIFGIGTIQISEFVKISLIIMLSHYISNIRYYKNIKYDIKCLLITLLIIIIPTILTYFEPDTGAIFMYLIISIAILLTSRIDYKWFLMAIIIIVIFLICLIYLYNNNISLLKNIFGSSIFLRLERLINWKKKNGMQLQNSLIAIGSAGIYGNGFKNNKIYYPEAHTDFIFTTFAANFGFIGSLILIITFLSFDLKIINIFKECTNKQNKYITSGIFSVFLYQQIQNIGMTIGLLPITGITLPFISYGGSSLLSYIIMFSLLININKKNKKHHNDA